MGLYAKKWVGAIFFLTGFYAQSSQASMLTWQPVKDLRQHFSHYVTTVSGAPTWTDAGQTQTFYLQPDIQNTYAVNHHTSTLGVGELFLGVQRAVYEHVDGQLGFAFAGSGMAKLSGQVWQDADPNYNNFNYTYNVNQFRVGLKGKLLANHYVNYVQPYISGNVSAGFNRAFSYYATPTISQAVVAPGFLNNTMTAFTYTLGIGIQRTLTTHWQAGMGYEFSDWGKSQLAAAVGQTLNSGLSLNHLYTNGLQFSLSYLS